MASDTPHSDMCKQCDLGIEKAHEDDERVKLVLTSYTPGKSSTTVPGTACGFST